MFEDEALALGRAAGLCFDPSTPRFRSLCCLLLDARIEAAEAIVGRDTGSPVSTPSGPTPPATGAAPLLTAAGPTLDRLIEEYTDEKLAGVGRANLISYDPVFRLLRGVLRRDCELSTIGNEQGKAILAAVRALPKNIGKNPQLKGLSVTEAIARGAVLGLPTIEAKTINLGYMAKASALFAWAVGEEYMKTNPVARRKVRDQVAASDKRDPFTMAQLTKLFDQAPWKPRDASGGGNPLRYWGALIALYQGMRLGEIAQLDVGDIEERSGVRMVRIRAGDGKRVKTGNSARALPIHPELERMGFVAYVAAQKGAGASKLFPGQGPNSRGQWGVSFSRWFTRLLGSLEFEGTLLGVHAFRHNFQDALREADLHGKGIGQELAGRSKGGDVSNNYGSGYSTRALTAAMGTIQYPELDLSHLYVS